MPIQDPTLYSKRFIGPGRVATLEDYHVNEETAGADIKFGQAVVIKKGVVIPATKAPIYGVALNRDWTSSIDFVQTEMDKDHYSEGQALDVLRDGTVSVTVSEDVNRGENATIDAEGNFKPAGTSDKVVGVFLSAANKDEVARLQTRIQLDHGNADDDTTNNPAPVDVQKDNNDASKQPGNASDVGSTKKN